MALADLLARSDVPPDVREAVADEIAAREQSEQALRESLAHQLEWARGPCVLACRFLPDGTVTSANDAFGDYFGLDPEALVGTSLLSMVPREERDGLKAHLAAFAPERAVLTYEHTVRGRDGGLRWLQRTDRAVFDGDALVEFQSSLRDVTELKEAERRLVIQRNLALTVLEITSVDGILPLCLEAAVDISGADGGCLYLVHPESRDLTQAAYQGVDGSFIATVSHIKCDSDHARLLLSGIPVYTRRPVGSLVAPQGGPRIIASLPIAYGGEVIAGINLLSRSGLVLGRACRRALEAGASIVGHAIGRFRAEEALRESHERYRRLVETASDWVWEVDENGVYTWVGPGVKQLLGYDAAELLGRTPFELWPPGDRERQMRAAARIYRSRAPFRGLEAVYRRRDGTDVVLETSGVPILARDGSFLGYRGMDRDVTARRREDDALRASEARYRALAEGAELAIMRLATDGTITFANEFAQRLFGYAADELIGRSILETVAAGTEGAADDFDRMVADLLADPEGQVLKESENVCRDGQRRRVAWANRAIRDEGGNVSGILCIGSDVAGNGRTGR
jgi:PAS domain S-box-containing protein